MKNQRMKLHKGKEQAAESRAAWRRYVAEQNKQLDKEVVAAKAAGMSYGAYVGAHQPPVTGKRVAK